MERDYSYVAAELKPEFIMEIYKLLGECGVQIPKHDLHATIIYDERGIDRPLAEMHPEREFRAFVTKLEPLGDGVVFHLTSPDLNEEFRRLRDAGYQHSYDTPLPHISIAYDFDEYDIMALNSVFSDWPGKELVFWKADYGWKKPAKKKEMPPCKCGHPQCEFCK